MAVEPHLALGVVAFEPWLAEGAFVDVAGEVAQGGDSAAYRAGIDNPILLPHLRIDLGIVACVLGGVAVEDGFV